MNGVEVFYESNSISSRLRNTAVPIKRDAKAAVGALQIQPQKVRHYKPVASRGGINHN